MASAAAPNLLTRAKLTESIPARCTEDEKRIIRERAESEGTSVSEYVIHAALSDSGVQAVSSDTWYYVLTETERTAKILKEDPRSLTLLNRVRAARRFMRACDMVLAGHRRMK